MTRPTAGAAEPGTDSEPGECASAAAIRTDGAGSRAVDAERRRLAAHAAEREPGLLVRVYEALRPRRAHVFRFFQRLGYHVTPVHFYQPIPDTRRLSEDLWRRRSEVPGVDMRPGAQLALLESFAARFKERYDGFPRSRGDAGGYYLDNNFFGRVDAEVLYAMVRHFRPRRVIEVGSGFSTLVTARALADAATDGAPPAALTTLDPHPNEAFGSLRELQAVAGAGATCAAVRELVQNVPLARFEELDAGDVLFVDSSHVLAIGSDVQYLFLEVLPRLRKGVVVHVHDIFLPYEYPRRWILGFHLFWTEQYLLQAFLAFNRAFEVLWASHYMHANHPEALTRAFASYDPDTVEPGSFWIRRIA